jgi:hypothetical protein
MMSPRLALAGLVALGLATPALGVAKPRSPPRPKLATAVNLENKRNISLLSFEVVMPGEDTPSKTLPGKDKTPETIVGKLEKPLGAGESASLKLTGAKGCVFEARWKFADVGDSGAVDLCNDARIVLVD